MITALGKYKLPATKRGILLSRRRKSSSHREYVNHVLKPSIGISLDIDIWEMVSSYFNAKAGPNGTIFPSTYFAKLSCLGRRLTPRNTGMWFQFAPDKDGRSQLFYGFPTLPWGPPNVTRISVDAATSRIKDPSERETDMANPEDIRDTQDFVKEHVVGVDSTVPAFTGTCLQTNVFGVYSLIIRGLKTKVAELVQCRQYVRSGLHPARVSPWRAERLRRAVHGRMGDEVCTLAWQGTGRHGPSWWF